MSTIKFEVFRTSDDEVPMECPMPGAKWDDVERRWVVDASIESVLRFSEMSCCPVVIVFTAVGQLPYLELLDACAPEDALTAIDMLKMN